MRARWLWVAAGLFFVLVAAAAAALFIGVAATSPEVVLSIRAPRIAMAIVVGGGLAVAGVLMQGSLGNPLADPALVGISGGAALGAVAAVALGASFNTGLASLAASLGAAGAVAVVVAVSIRGSRPEIVTLLLAGVAVTAFTTAVLAVLVSVSDTAGARSINFWTTGSLALSTWAGVLSIAPFALVGLVLAATTPTSLDALSLGDRGAAAVGVNVTAVRYRSLGAVVLLVAAGVATVGVIAFVGLLVPHAMRGIVGPRHGPLLIVSAFAGALLVLGADTVARVVANPVEIPIGAVTALIGAPAFFVLLRRTRANQGGWA